MKNIYNIIAYSAALVLLATSVILAVRFSNSISSAVLNLVFALIMFGVLLFSMRYIRKFNLLIEDLKHGTENLKVISKGEQNPLLSENQIFTNKKLISLLDEYITENKNYDGDISDYIDTDLLDEEINRHVSDLTAGVMTGIGLLGTFVGFMIGIKDLKINQDELLDSIKTLMDGMKTAFLTSIYGVVYSIVFNSYYKYVYSCGINALNEFYSVFYSNIASNPENKNMNQLLEYQRSQVEAFNRLPEVVAGAVANEMDRIFTPTITRLDGLMEEFINSATENQMKNLEILVNSFVENMNQSLNDKFALLSETIGRTCELQFSTNEMMQNVIDDIAENYKYLNDINRSLEKTLESIIDYESVIQKYNESIIANNKEGHELLMQIQKSQMDSDGVIQRLSAEIKNFYSYMDQTKNILINQKNNIEYFNNQSRELIDYNAESFEKIISKNNELAEKNTDIILSGVDLISDKIIKFEEVSEKLISEINSIGGGIRSECDNLEVSLGKSLNSTFKAFDENLSEITASLNDSVKEIQKLVEGIYPSLSKSINRMKESMDNCASKFSETVSSGKDD